MSNLGCYNCKDPSHKAANCPEDPLYTRCPDCNKFVKDRRAHHPQCNNKEFISVYIGPAGAEGASNSCSNTRASNATESGPNVAGGGTRPKLGGVFELNNVIQFEFRDVNDEFVIVEDNRDHPINMFPLRVNSIDAYLAHGKAMSLSLVYGKWSKRTITFVSEKNVPIASFCFDETHIIVGNRIRIQQNGNTSMNVNAMNSVFEGRSCHIKVRSGDKFSLRVKPWMNGDWLYFDVFEQFGPFLLDAQTRAKNNQQRNTANAAIKAITLNN